MIAISHLEFNLQWSSSIIELTTLDDTVTETVSFCTCQAFYEFLLFVQTSIMHKSPHFCYNILSIIILKIIIFKCRLAPTTYCTIQYITSNIRKQMYDNIINQFFIYKWESYVKNNTNNAFLTIQP